MIVVFFLLVFTVLSPFVAILAALVLVVGVPMIAYRLLRRRPVRRPGLVVLGSLIVLLQASGVSAALYGTAD